jgi:hypothetical protein
VAAALVFVSVFLRIAYGALERAAPAEATPLPLVRESSAAA